MAYGRSAGSLMCSLYRMESGGTSGYVVYDTRSGENKYGWTYNNNAKRYYFDDIGNESLMGLWEDQWLREADEAGHV